jgi:hypothetical protein
MTTPWLRLDRDVLRDGRIVLAVQQHGPLGIATWIYALTTAKLQNQAGRVELEPVVLAREVNAKRADCEDALATLAQVGLIEHVEDDVYQVRHWVDYQKEDRSYAAQAERKALHPGRKSGRARIRTDSHGFARKPRDNDNDIGPPTGDSDSDSDKGEGADVGDSKGADVRGPINVSDVKPPDDDSRIECEHLAEWIVRNGGKRPTISVTWLRDAERMRRIDGRTHEQVMAAIDWCQQDNFWRANILSPGKLREKYEQLRLAAARSPASQTQARQETRAALAERLMQEGGS